jgi:hypothetical protein
MSRRSPRGRSARRNQLVPELGEPQLVGGEHLDQRHTLARARPVAMGAAKPDVAAE